MTKYFCFIALFVLGCSEEKKNASTTQQQYQTEPSDESSPSQSKLTNNVWTLETLDLPDNSNAFLNSLSTTDGTVQFTFKKDSSFTISMGQSKAQGKWAIDEKTGTMTTMLGRTRATYKLKNTTSDRLEMTTEKGGGSLVFKQEQ